MVKIEMTNDRGQVLLESLVLTAALLRELGKSLTDSTKLMLLSRAQERAVFELGQALTESNMRKQKYRECNERKL